MAFGRSKESKYIFKGNITHCLGTYAGGNDVRFALYQRREQSLSCMILFLVHGTAARIVAQDQNRTTLMEIARRLQ